MQQSLPQSTSNTVNAYGDIFQNSSNVSSDWQQDWNRPSFTANILNSNNTTSPSLPPLPPVITASPNNSNNPSSMLQSRFATTTATSNNSLIPHLYSPYPTVSRSSTNTSNSNNSNNHGLYRSYSYHGSGNNGRPVSNRPRLTTTLWEDESTLCYQVDCRGICVARRQDNDMINGTKLLNVAGMSRGKRDGILKNERGRIVVKVGAMHLKGVWIPFVRAKALANQFKILDILYPIFSDDPTSFLYPSHFHQLTRMANTLRHNNSSNNTSSLMFGANRSYLQQPQSNSSILDNSNIATTTNSNDPYNKYHDHQQQQPVKRSSSSLYYNNNPAILDSSLYHTSPTETSPIFRDDNSSVSGSIASILKRPKMDLLDDKNDGVSVKRNNSISLKNSRVDQSYNNGYAYNSNTSPILRASPSPSSLPESYKSIHTMMKNSQQQQDSNNNKSFW